MNISTFLRTKEWRGKILETKQPSWPDSNEGALLLLRNDDFNKWNKANWGHTTVQSTVSISDYLLVFWEHFDGSWKLHLHNVPNTGQALYLLSYENSSRARSFTCNWIHMWTDSLSLILKFRPERVEETALCYVVQITMETSINCIQQHIISCYYRTGTC